MAVAGGPDGQDDGISPHDDLRALPILDGLSDLQLAQLLDCGEMVRVAPGADLFHEGHPAESWWLVVAGSLALMRRVGREYTVVGRMPPGRWAGEFKAWDEHGVYLATGNALQDGWVFRLPSAELKRLSAEWFPFGGHLIQGLYGTARTIEATARQRESLVTLGTLAAGLAHEINNPAAAAARAVSDLDDASRTLLSSLGHLAAGEISAAQFAGLDALRQEIRPLESTLSPLAMSDREDELAEWLEDHGVDSAWTIAPVLAAAGADLDWCAQASTILPAAALEPGLEWVASTFSMVSLLADVRQSTRGSPT